MSQRKGGTRARHGKIYARVRIGGKEQIDLLLPWAKPDVDDEAAAARAGLIAELAEALLLAGRKDLVRKYARELGRAANEKRLAAIVKIVRGIVAGTVVTEKPIVGITMTELLNEVLTDDFHTRFPDHVKKRKPKTCATDRGRARDYIIPIVGGLPAVAMDLPRCDEVMRRLPAKLESATRRQVAQVLARALKIATYPLKYIPHSPIPRGWLPKIQTSKEYACLYPDEDRQLLAAPEDAVPFWHRLWYGILDREGLRSEELLAATWAHVDLVRGVFRLDKNKTDDPRSWKMSAGVLEALRIVRAAMAPNAPLDASIFPEDAIARNHRAGDFRAHLQAAGITRPELFEEGENRQPIRVHDLRATFVTTSITVGRSEFWIRDRTGHTTTSMIDRYRRQARTWVELNLGDLAPLVDAIPELRSEAMRELARSAYSAPGGGGEDGVRTDPFATSGEVEKHPEFRANGTLASPTIELKIRGLKGRESSSLSGATCRETQVNSSDGEPPSPRRRRGHRPHPVLTPVRRDDLADYRCEALSYAVLEREELGELRARARSSAERAREARP